MNKGIFIFSNRINRGNTAVTAYVTNIQQYFEKQIQQSTNCTKVSSSDIQNQLLDLQAVKNQITHYCDIKYLPC